MTLADAFAALFAWRKPRGPLPDAERDARRVCETEQARLRRAERSER